MAEIVHKNKFFEVKKIDVHGYEVYGIVERDVAVILPFIDKTNILLEKQLRPVVGEKIYEVPAGHIDKKESPSVGANRELEEETGYRAKKLKLLAKYYINPGVSTVTEYLFLATDLVKGNISRDVDEEMVVRKVPIKTALEYVRNGTIKDAKSMIAILTYFDKQSSSE